MFELSIALRYLVPRFKQLSVSIISSISILVIALVVWLAVIFLSVTTGIEKSWIEKLVALNGSVQITPTNEYHHSYYHKIDPVSLSSNYQKKVYAINYILPKQILGTLILTWLFLLISLIWKLIVTEIP